MTSGGLRIRDGAPGDLSAVRRIETASFADPWPPEALVQELTPSRLRVPLTAERDGEVVGYLMAWRTADQLHILNLAVAPAHRRRGVGAALLETALAEARHGGMREVTLEVRPGNTAARAMYRTFGFREAGLRPSYYADTGEDALVLTLRLPAG